MIDLSSTWRSYHVVSIDFETTSPDPLTCEPVEVSAVRFDGNGNIVARFTSLLRPEHPIPDDATRVHGISNEMVQDAPTLADVRDKLADIANGAVPLAYNRGFDRTVLHRYLSGEGVSIFDHEQPWLCAYAMAWSADRWEPGTGRHKLAACCDRRGIRIVGAHRAEADAVACGMLFHALLAKQHSDLTMAAVMSGVDKREAEREAEHKKWRKKCREEDRIVWREYAKAALSGLLGCGRFVRPDAVAIAAESADDMLALEKSRFVGGNS